MNEDPVFIYFQLPCPRDFPLKHHCAAAQPNRGLKDQL